MQILNILQPIASVSGYLITIITLITLIFKPIRIRVINKITSKYIEKRDAEEIANSFEELKEMIKDIHDSVKENEILCREHSESIEDLRRALQSNLRNAIIHLYYKYTSEGSEGIPIYEKENLIYLYEAYDKFLKGNSFVKEIYDELIELPVIKTVKARKINKI